MRSETEHIYCTRCGKQIKREYLFCNYCGEPVKLQKSSVRADPEDMKAEEKIPDSDIGLDIKKRLAVSSDDFEDLDAGSFSAYDREGDAARESLFSRVNRKINIKSIFLAIKRLITQNRNIKRVVYALIAGIVWVIGLINIPSDIHVDWRGMIAMYTNGSNLKVDSSVDPDERIINLVILGIMQNNGDYLYDTLPQEYRDSSPGSLRFLMVEELTDYTLKVSNQFNEEIGYDWKWRLRSRELEEYRDEEKTRYDLEKIKYEIEKTYDVEPIEVKHVSVVITAKARSSIRTYSLRIPFNIFRSEYGWALDYESLGNVEDE